jgi:hypothetical protein
MFAIGTLRNSAEKRFDVVTASSNGAEWADFDL